MKQTVIIILIFGLCVYNNSTRVKSADNELSRSTKDSLVRVDSFWLDESEIHSGEYKQFYCCQFWKFLDDPKTPKLAKDIYLDNEWNLDNDDEALALLDSLTAKNITSRPFYFKVVTKTYKKSDGYYSEGLGLAGSDFVKKHTQEFVSYFDDRMCHTNSDLCTWADIVLLEFAISEENIDEYIEKVKINCKDCSTTQKETINEFGLILQEKWKYYLKHID
jgi:hypothetical protein